MLTVREDFVICKLSPSLEIYIYIHLKNNVDQNHFENLFTNKVGCFSFNVC